MKVCVGYHSVTLQHPAFPSSIFGKAKEAYKVNLHCIFKYNILMFDYSGKEICKFII